MNPAAEQLYRTALRDSIFKLLNDLDMPGHQAQAGRAWVQAKKRPVEALERMKARTLQVLQDARADKQLRAA